MRQRWTAQRIAIDGPGPAVGIHHLTGAVERWVDGGQLILHDNGLTGTVRIVGRRKRHKLVGV